MRRALALSGALWMVLCSMEAAAVSPPSTSAGQEGALSTSEQKFLKDAAVLHARAMAAGKHAQDRALSPGLRRYGQTIHDDHKRALEEVRRVASKHGVTLKGTDVPPITQTMRDDVMLARLVSSEQRAARLFMKAEKQVSDPLVVELVEGNVGIMKDHVRVGQRLRKTLREEKRSTPRELDVDLAPPE